MTHRTTWQAVLTLFSLLLAALVLFGPLAGTAQAGQDKVAVCHLNGDGNYISISIADPALPTHQAHGDLVVGVDVDENCQPLDADSDGVPNDVDNCLDVANPSQEDRYGSAAGDACEDLDGDGTLDVNEADFCLSIDGVLLESRGTTVCDSTSSTGTGSNVAVANGDETYALAVNGNNNSATATGDGTEANVLFGDNNSATATGEGAKAYAFFGNNNSATATGAGAFAGAGSGDDNSATATGAGAHAEATLGSNNSATSTGVYTCAGNGDDGETAVNEDLCSN